MTRVRLPQFEPLLFAIFAATCTLLSARSFFDARQCALQFAEAARQAAPLDHIAHRVPSAPWSAPLDDVFIHFDFARSLAGGRFFEWAPGGGYSSGATSWLYPAVLAVAYRLGLTGFALGRFADWFACLCVFGGLWALRRAYREVGAWFSYLLCAALMSLGVFDWALWSGMELPLFFLLWCSGQAVYQRVGELRDYESVSKTAWGLGVLGLLLVATRPEAVLCVSIWYAFIWHAQRKTRTHRELAKLALFILGPAILLIGFRTALNRVLTGEFADAGSLVKLEPLAPFYDLWEITKLWIANVGFQFGRITAYHAGDSAIWGSMLWLLVIGSLWMKSTRRSAALLCAMALAWMAVVANNEYVRYQNDRYTMPALAWFVVSAAAGVQALAQKSIDQRTATRSIGQRWSPIILAFAIVLVWNRHQSPRFRQQTWLFGRACRNIAEQQVRLGLLLHAAPDAANRRILVGDAGAIEYFSNLPGVDAIGLGGALGLPFARAVRLGIGATVELIERLSPQQRPDLLALYPSWWKELPLWFGRPILELTIDGNAICGDSRKVLYDAEWRGLEPDSAPSTLAPGWHVIDELDIADLVSESRHAYGHSHRHSGYVFMKILPNIRNPSRDLFDAGRILFDGQRANFTLKNFTAGRALRLIFRSAPAEPMHCRARYDGREIGRLMLPPKDGWQESSLDVSAELVRNAGNVEIIAEHSECNLFHIWALQPDP